MGGNGDVRGLVEALLINSSQVFLDGVVSETSPKLHFGLRIPVLLHCLELVLIPVELGRPANAFPSCRARSKPALVHLEIFLASYSAK